eukprot:CAMPEP_0183771768 /NCGR_PEP_ID=MMETSP0739-20130205/33733_1 /TAXON_ID=385413 /ORGANISM="Thalassiosira miniscula, Strain CCMP1093" /LENGTH=54 /DNA_ID=CAMNT_0026012267 /DNA_START=119 /DNA_END=283 /DNA_ORIENTATION=+
MEVSKYDDDGETNFMILFRRGKSKEKRPSDLSTNPSITMSEGRSHCPLSVSVVG